MGSSASSSLVEVKVSGVIRVEAPQQLKLIDERIHDRWFWISDIDFDEAAGTVVIAFEDALPEARRLIRRLGPFKQFAIPIVEVHLKINNVVAWRAEDSEGVDKVDFNSLDFNAARKVLRVLTNIPSKCEAEISDLDVVLEPTGKGLSTRASWTLV